MVFAGSTERSWRDGTRGLGARDIAMNVALPEVDGRVIGRAVSFKDHARRDALTETERWSLAYYVLTLARDRTIFDWLFGDDPSTSSFQ